MGATPYWHDEPVEWDALRLNYRPDGSAAPGIVRDINVDREYKEDEKDGNGANGATLTIGGRKLARVTITLELWTKRHLDLLDKFRRAVFPGGNATTKPFDCIHPVLAHHDLKALLFTKLTGPRRVREGIYHVQLTAKEFSPPPPKPKASVASTPKSSVGGLPPGWKRGIWGEAISPEQQAYEQKLSNWANGKGPHPGPKPTYPSPPATTTAAAAAPPKTPGPG